jgi:hypothetical protein
VSRGFGVPGRLITTPEELRAALADKTREPRLFDVLVA